MNREKGITLIALIITIIVLLIIAGVTIGGAIRGIDESQENKLFSELKMVQHAIVERKTKYDLTGQQELLKGTKINNINDIDITDDEGTNVKLNLKLTQADIDSTEKAYYRLNEQDLKAIGLEPATETGVANSNYIVNYSTGEVYNETVKKSPTGKLLYIASE